MSKHKWLREDRTVYTLEHDGWRKGVEEFRNRFTISVQGDPRVPAEETLRIAEFVETALNAHEDLVAALTTIRSVLSVWSLDLDKSPNTILSFVPMMDAAIDKAKGES